jgi:hypothetical protein
MKISQIAFITALLVFLALAGAAAAQTGGGYDLTWNTLEPGGPSTGGDYWLRAVIGQPDAASLTGGAYTLAGGFLPGPADLRRIYLPIVLKQS